MTDQVMVPDWRDAGNRRDRVVGIAPDVTARTDAVAALQNALAHGELRVVYQPILRLATGAVGGVEALVRWAHPERGLLLPGDFLPLAEQTGLTLPIGRWVRNESCRQVRAWQQRFPQDPPLRLSTNLSVGEFHQADLVEHLTSTLAESGFAPEHLTLEVTESAMIAADPEVSVSAMSALKWLGVQLAFDDFGTEYGSLSAFKRFPVDQLKVDRSFVAGLGRTPEDTAIVRAVVDVAKTLGLTVVAEGVETAEQVAQLRDLGCDEGQGYFFAPPLGPQQLEAFLEIQSATLDIDEAADHNGVTDHLS